jgi:hypothetical protein
MTLARRHVLGLGALGAGAVALDACGSGLPWAKSAGPSPGDVDRVLSDLDGLLARLGALEPDPTRFGIKRERSIPAAVDAVKQILTTVCCLGSYRDVPESYWHEPRVEDHLSKTLPFIDRTIEKARAYIDGLSAEDVARIDRRLQRDPELTMRVMEKVDDYAKEIHAPLEQRTYLRTATAQLAGRFRYEGLKEVSSKLTGKYAKTLATRKNDFGMAPDENAGGGEQPKTLPTPLRVQFHTRATPEDVRAATCALVPAITDQGETHPILLDWEEFRCPTAIERGAAAHPIRGGVHVEPGEPGMSIVTLVVYPPPDATYDLADVVTKLGRELKTRVEDRVQAAVDEACTTSDTCHGLRCIRERCVDPSAPPKTPPPIASAHLGQRGDACRNDADCSDPNTCVHGACDPNERTSSKLMKTTGKVAKWGAILLIPPICAVGILVLLTCLFMVIVAGFEYAGGD